MLTSENTRPRPMTAWEIGAFLGRHPLTAARVAATEAAMKSGLYDINIFDKQAEWGTLTVQFPGVIDPIGIQEYDVDYGVVTISPTPTMTLNFIAFSPVMGDAGKPAFESPSGNSVTQTLSDAATAINNTLTTVAVVGIVVYLAGQFLAGRRK